MKICPSFSDMLINNERLNLCFSLISGDHYSEELTVRTEMSVTFVNDTAKCLNASVGKSIIPPVY